MHDWAPAYRMVRLSINPQKPVAGDFEHKKTRFFSPRHQELLLSHGNGAPLPEALVTLVGWLVGWLVVCLVGWLVVWLVS